MAAANDSQGLKIAVAAFVTLTVVLAVATYFAFSSYSEAQAKFEDEQKKASAAQSAAREALTNFDSLKQLAGYNKFEEPQAALDQVKKDYTKLDTQLTDINGRLKQMIGAYQNAGGSQAKVAELQMAADQIVTAVTSEPNKTLADTQDRLVQLLDNMSQLNTQLVFDNESLRTSLGSVDQTNAQQLQVQSDEVRKTKEDLAKEHDTHETERMDLLRRYDELQNLTAQQATDIAGLKQQLAQMKDSTDKQRDTLLAQVRQWREQVEKDEDVMDTPDGKVQFVDYSRGEIRTNITRSQGARERMQFAIFDAASPGMPTDTPKGLVELIQVTDSGSIARIVRTNKPSDPIRANDHLYSAAWSPNRPERFALIGKIDIDQDGRDDRENLKRMIQGAGGVVDFDLPPPGTGKESGELSGLTSWYVIDDRDPIRPSGLSSIEGLDDQDYLTKRGQAIEEARSNGVRPISIERLLAYLGYKFGQSEVGRTEAVNTQATRDLLNPRGLPSQPAATGTESP